MTENQIQGIILEWLGWNRIFHYRNNTGAAKRQYTNKRGVTKDSFVRFGVAGAPDIICVLTICGLPVIVGIEVKSLKGKQSDHQKEWQKSFERVGGFYILTNNLDDFIVQIKNVKNEALSLVSKADKSKTVSL